MKDYGLDAQALLKELERLVREYDDNRRAYNAFEDNTGRFYSVQTAIWREIRALLDKLKEQQP
jgi:hypothetical protein